MKLVMNMVRKPFKQGDVIFETSERSDELYLIHTGSVEIRSREGLVLATLKQGELFGEMASIMGERERTATAVAGANTVIDVIDATTMQRKLGEAEPVLRALRRALAATQHLSQPDTRGNRASLTAFVKKYSSGDATKGKRHPI